MKTWLKKTDMEDSSRKFLEEKLFAKPKSKVSQGKFFSALPELSQTNTINLKAVLQKSIEYSEMSINRSK